MTRDDGPRFMLSSYLNLMFWLLVAVVLLTGLYYAVRHGIHGGHLIYIPRPRGRF